jgi:hypothetical protein
MVAQGALRPEQRAEYWTALDRLRAVEGRHREPKSDGQRELHRITHWVLDQWGDEQEKLLATPDNKESD